MSPEFKAPWGTPMAHGRRGTQLTNIHSTGSESRLSREPQHLDAIHGRRAENYGTGFGESFANLDLGIDDVSRPEVLCQAGDTGIRTKRPLAREHSTGRLHRGEARSQPQAT